MKVDNFKFIPEDVEKFTDSLNNLLKEYEKEIQSLELLIKEISTSTSWKNDEVKVGFVSTCNAYIKIYKQVIEVIMSRIKFLQKKTNQFIEVEDLYKKE